MRAIGVVSSSATKASTLTPLWITLSTISTTMSGSIDFELPIINNNATIPKLVMEYNFTGMGTFHIEIDVPKEDITIDKL